MGWIFGKTPKGWPGSFPKAIRSFSENSSNFPNTVVSNMQWCQCLIESPILLKSMAPIFLESIVYGSRLIFPPVASDNCVTMSLTATAGFPRHLFPRDQRMNICDNILRSCIFLHGNKKTKDMRSIEFSSLNVLMRDKATQTWIAKLVLWAMVDFGSYQNPFQDSALGPGLL